MMPVGNVFYIFENVDTRERNYIFIKNVLRFRRASIATGLDPEWCRDKVYLQFIMKDNVRIGFFITEKEWHSFKDSLPQPNGVTYHFSPPSRTSLPNEQDDEHILVVNDSSDS